MTATYSKLYGARRTPTAKATPDAASEIDLTGLPARAKVVFAFEPGRTVDITLLDGSGGELLITTTMGGDDHYTTPPLLVEDGPFQLKSAGADTVITLSVLEQGPA